MHPLPQELIDAILAHLRDYASLSVCSLVSNSFVAPSQRGIFRSLWLHAQGSHPTFHDATAALAQFPHLKSYIHDLTITLASSDTEFDHSALEGAVYWDRLSYGLRSAIQTVVSLPSLQELHLATYFVGVPSHFILRAASSVSFLSIRRITLDEGEEIEFSVPEAGLPGARESR
ncbi:hypothetical protein C8J57DRAFT_1639881 [Mycena rebaudengoi]|nr:hypothetical protein C8J57DRAFT_1639881 [Mycena rebaudengoi]